MTPLQRLLKQPQRFGFDAAVRLLRIATRQPDPAATLRFRSVPSLAQPTADVTAVTPNAQGRLDVAVTVMGLTGATGVLPRSYTEVLNATLRNRSRALHAFLDTLSHRLVAHFARARVKYQPHLAAETAGLGRSSEQPGTDPIRGVLLALTGHGTPGLTDRLAIGQDALAHYAGFFAAHPRSADRLQALVSDWCGRPVEVRQFAGAWLKLPPDQRSALGRGLLPGQFDRLGVDAAVGVRAWDAQAGIVLRIGPLDLAAFEALMPDRPGLQRMVSLVRAFLGYETGFAINPVLAADALPRLQIGVGARLGWNTWLRTDEARWEDRDEAVFGVDVVNNQGINQTCLVDPAMGRPMSTET